VKTVLDLFLRFYQTFTRPTIVSTATTAEPRKIKGEETDDKGSILSEGVGNFLFTKAFKLTYEEPHLLELVTVMDREIDQQSSSRPEVKMVKRYLHVPNSLD
jgi:hypothetical protein